MELSYNTRYPSVDDLREKARKRIPKFAFEYLDGGCNDDVNLIKNTAEIRQLELVPKYLSGKNDKDKPSLQTTLFGHTYDAPFGIAPVGLQGLMWPKATEILAKAAFDTNVPFVLSTVASASIEAVSEITQGKAWFQLYHPAENSLRDDIIKRLDAVECPVLVLLCDVPSFGYRPRDIRNGLAMPPRMTLNNLIEIALHPTWALNTLIKGQPEFATLKPYMPKGLDMRQLGLFMNKTFNGKLTHDKIAAIRDKWKGKLVLKGVASKDDVAAAIQLGLDGVIVSNHGGRQLDAGQSAISALLDIAPEFKNKISLMFDSGLRSGPDVARAMAAGADFTFLGRSFMYGVAALGNEGGNHTIAITKTQLQQVMEQVCCENVQELSNHLLNNTIIK
jgi:L-lactate dehydrogenase (cytochrome)